MSIRRNLIGSLRAVLFGLLCGVSRRRIPVC